MGSSCAHYQNKLETKKQYLTTLWERIHGENPKKQKTSRKPTKNNIWRLFGKAPSTKSKKTRENQKKQKNKTFQRMFGQRLMFVFFWFCLVFFVFFWSWPWKNKKNSRFFFCFLDKMMVKEVWKNKKLKVFFCFWVFVALVSFWLRNEKPKKNFEFFWFFTLL